MYNEICGEILDAVFDPFQWNQDIYLYLPVSQMGNIDGNNFTQQNNGCACRTRKSNEAEERCLVHKMQTFPKAFYP